jgi:hypothetical protein
MNNETNMEQNESNQTMRGETNRYRRKGVSEGMIVYRMFSDFVVPALKLKTQG